MYLDNQQIAHSFRNQECPYKTPGVDTNESYNRQSYIENLGMTSQSNIHKVATTSHLANMPECQSHPTMPESHALQHSNLLDMSGLSNCMISSGGIENCSSKRKRDWLSTLNSPGQNSANKCANSLITSVKVSNGSSLPPGWEQYMDLKSGEMYYVNWKTRTKHLRIQCPEVQKCLAEAMALRQSTCDKAHNLQQDVHTPSNSSTERWLSKMTAAASALANGAKDSVSPKSPHTPNIQAQPSNRMNFSMVPTQNHVTTDLLGNLMRKSSDRTSSASQVDNHHPNASDQQAQPLAAVVCGVCNMFVMLSSHSCPNCNTILVATSPSDNIASSTST